MRKPIQKTDFPRRIEEVRPLLRGFDELNDHVIITDPDANILYANKAVKRVTGFAPAEILGKNPADLWGGHMPPAFYVDMWRTIKTEKSPFVGEVKNQTKAGKEIWQEMHISPVLDARGEVRFFIGLEPNITDRKLRERFSQEFVSLVGHQLRNPITAIRWFLDLMKSENTLTDRQHSRIDDIYRNNMNLADLVNDLLLISRTGAAGVKREKIDMAKMLRGVIVDVRRAHPDVSFRFDADGAFPLMVDAPMALQVFTNIISNAAEYVDQRSGTVEMRLEKSDGAYRFSCKDDGIGIPADEQAKVFSKLFRATNAKTRKEGGTGLGLFIVKLIADSFGWDVAFKSREGEGTIFLVTIR